MKQWIYGFVILLIVTACTDDIEVEQSVVGDREVNVTLNFGAVNHSQVKVDSRTTYGLQYESMVRNLYVYLFTSDGKRFYGRHFGEDLKNQTRMEEHWMVTNMSSTDTDTQTQGSVKMKVPTVTNAEIIMIANIDLDFLNLSEERLSLVRNKKDLQDMILTLNQTRPERNAGYFMMTGSSKVNITEQNGNATVTLLDNSENIIQLKRLDAKIEVNVRVNPTENSDNQQVQEFIPESWEVVNLPKSSYLLPHSTDPSQTSQDAFFNLTPMNFETTSKDGDAILNGFSFYMLENREEKKKSVNNNLHFRDMRVKHLDDIHADNYGTYNTAGDMWEYAPEYGTYVIIKGELKMLVNTDDATPQHLTADVTYHIHLGDFGTDRDDYNILRNTNYKYTITIKGVNNIELEVETSNDNVSGITENQPGASGHLYTAKETDTYTFDAHYGQRVYTLRAQDIDVENITWYVKTPMGRDGVPEKHPISGVETYEYMDYKWVEFMLNPKDDDNLYSEANQPYPPLADQPKVLMTVIDFVKLLKEQKTLWEREQNYQPENKTNIFDKEGKINVTVFVNEYYYTENPRDPNDTNLLWKKFVNQPNRLMHILSSSQYSKDGDSSVTGSILTVRQRSIQTPFNINKDMTDLKYAWGCETVDEMNNQAWFYTPDERRTSGNSKRITEYTPQNTSRTDGLYNTACLLNLVTQNLGVNNQLRWDTFLDFSGNEVQLKGKYKAGLYSVFLRNRDLNGDGFVNPNELRWYIASLDQLCGLFLGDQGLNGDAQLYPISASREPNVPIVGGAFDGVYPWRLHVVSSTAWDGAGSVPTIVWAEEGASTGEYQVHHNKPAYSPVRCVRNLGMEDANSTTIKKAGENFPSNTLVQVTKPSSVDNSSVYRFDFSNMNEDSRRYYTTRELVPGDEYSVMSRLYDGFETGPWYGSYGRTYSDGLKTLLENGGSPSTNNAQYGGYRVPNFREGVVMYLYCDDSKWWNGSFLVSNYYSFGYYGNGYDRQGSTNYYSWAISKDVVTVGEQGCSRIRFVKDWNP